MTAKKPVGNQKKKSKSTQNKLAKKKNIHVS